MLVSRPNSLENIIGDCNTNLNIYTVITEGMAATCDNNWVGTLTEMNIESGYWILVDDPPVSLSGYGLGYDPGRVYDLNAGSNLISYPSLSSSGISSSIPDDVEGSFLSIIDEGSSAVNTENGWVGSLTQFQNSSGYWIIVSEGLSFSYELDDMAREEIKPYVETLPIGSAFEVFQSTSQAFYFVDDITLDEGCIEDGDWLLSYKGSVLTGIRQWQGVMIDVSAMGVGENTETKGYFEEGDIPIFKLLRQSTGDLIPLAGEIPTWSSNGIYILNHLTQMKPIPESFSLDNAYPNPFNPVTTLEFGIPLDMEVSINVYNLQGRLIETLAQRYMEAGYHSVVWNADSHPSGIYFVNMRAYEYVNTQKLMLIK